MKCPYSYALVARFVEYAMIVRCCPGSRLFRLDRMEASNEQDFPIWHQGFSHKTSQIFADYMTERLKLVQTKVPYGHPVAILWPYGTRHAGRILDLERHLCIYSGTGAVQTRTFGQFGDRF